MKIVKKILITLLLLDTFATTLYGESNVSKEDNNISNLLQQEFKKNRIPLLQHLSSKRFLRTFYDKNSYKPLWIDKNGLKDSNYQELFQKINSDITLDKDAILFKKSKILQKELDANLSKERLFRVEVQLTSLYYEFLKHSIYGEIEWKDFATRLHRFKRYRINAKWVRKEPNFNLAKLLMNPDINATLKKIKPKKFGYDKLLQALRKLYTLKKSGGWEKLPYFKVLKLKSTGEVVLKLRERLKASGDYISCEENRTLPIQNNESNESLQKPYIDPNAIFGVCLNKAVKHFQKRHGLEIDGIVGGATQKALNETVEEKIERVLLNIDRIKWLPRDYDKRYIIINIPEFMLYYIEDNKVKKEIRVIIGAKKHPTPIFSEEISYIVLNPYWKIPAGILKREIIPKVIKNIHYLKKQGLVIHRTWNERSQIINPYHIYWEQYLAKGVRFPYRIMQPPGPKNALGKIKFKFPNMFDVYLHDTPTRHLFKKDIRAFSHGCVRISEPHSLLETVSSFNKNINMSKADKILKGKRKVIYNIKNKLPIHLVYLTSGLNSSGELEFRDDIYGYDKLMKRSIK